MQISKLINRHKQLIENLKISLKIHNSDYISLIKLVIFLKTEILKN